MKVMFPGSFTGKSWGMVTVTLGKVGVVPSSMEASNTLTSLGPRGVRVWVVVPEKIGTPAAARKSLL